MEKYPVYIDGTQCGSLRVYHDGLMTVFDAECRCGERLVRLSIYGGGKSAAIGAGKGETAPCEKVQPSANAHPAADNRIRGG